MMKKTRKKVEIMTAMLKGLGNDGNDEGTWEFCNSVYESRQSVYVIHQMIKAIHVSFSYYEKSP